ncbi:hypothetical protein GRS48_04370 [Halorubrum sp. JWXQ-INN 858]|uniref:coiled-coil domain-containing protein n=1 Tax=Halorubrum sp. JWXQ-INN 858 TaxID=2690782 RepID=UPI0013571670|nr:hypothetical protein [Halorubrum sp. JWXQ-INN 858]MWV64061.1 hypothetical protein [Halorubrum sp. JWXQ-INN 858]
MSDIDALESALDDAASESGVSREEVLKRAIVALAEANGVDVPSDDDVARIESVVSDLDETTDRLESTATETTEDLEALAARTEELSADLDGVRTDVDALESDTDALEADVDAKVEDLRDRLVRIYRDVEDRAAADHAHPDTEATVEDLAATVAGLEDAVADVDARLDALRGESDDVGDRVSTLESRVEEGLDRDDDVAGKLSRVANAVVGVQRRLASLERRAAGRERLSALTTAANRHGVRTADCAACRGTVDLALLSTPDCPHCDRRFADLDPKTGFFGTSRLTVGDPPALEGDVSPTPSPTATRADPDPGDAGSESTGSGDTGSEDTDPTTDGSGGTDGTNAGPDRSRNGSERGRAAEPRGGEGR